MRPRFAGVRVRVTAIAVVVVGLALVSGAGLLLRAQRNSLEDDIETTARLRATDLAAAVGEGSLPSALTVSRQEQGVVQVLDDQRHVVASSANVAGAPPISEVVAPETGFASVTVRVPSISTSEFQLVATRSSNRSHMYTVYVAASHEEVDKSIRTLGKLLTFGLPALLAVVGLVTWFVVGRALGPVESIRREVEVISERDLHRRVPEPVVLDEVGRLAHTMNAMLSRLEQATVRQRRFVADASHELRNPLTSIRAQLEVDRAHPDGADWNATRTDVLAETVRMQRLVDDLLLLARADAGHIEGRRDPVDLDDIVLREARRARTRADLRVDTAAVSGGQVRGDADQLNRVVRNLVDNAARHAAATLTITLDEDGDSVVLTVADDGPGIEPTQRARIFDRFARLDDARDRDQGGVGLGLAISREIVVAHAGAISVEDARPGARFVVRLPAA